MKTTKIWTVVVVAAALGVFSVPAGAAVISPLNGSFELPAFPAGTVYTGTLPTSWGAAGTSHIIHHPLASTTPPHPLYAPPADGIALYGLEYVNGSNYTGVQQDLGTMTAGETYTFQATLYSNSEGLPSGHRISFYNVTGSQELKAITQADFDPSAGGTLQTMPASFSYTATAADDGDVMRLILKAASPGSGQGRTGVDAVTVTSTFEPPGLVHQWTFEDGTGKDSIGPAHGTLSGGATIVNGRLSLDGNAGTQMLTDPIGNGIGAKTLVSWVSLDTLQSTGGSALTLETDNFVVFDGIVYGEVAAQKWMAGSNGYVRTQYPQTFGSVETVTNPGEVMVAIVYDTDNSITLYRDGVLYGSYTKGSLVNYDATALVQFGPRHGPHVHVFDGFINEARIYGRALEPAEVLYLFNQGPAVPEPGTLVLLALGSGLLGMAGFRRARRRPVPAT